MTLGARAWEGRVHSLRGMETKKPSTGLLALNQRRGGLKKEDTGEGRARFLFLFFKSTPRQDQGCSRRG